MPHRHSEYRIPLSPAIGLGFRLLSLVMLLCLLFSSTSNRRYHLIIEDCESAFLLELRKNKKKSLFFRVTVDFKPFEIMGSEVCADELMDELNSSKKLISKVADEICGDSVESRIGTLVTQSSKLKDNQRTSIGPVTPESNRENVEQNHDWLSPPTVLSSPTRVPCSSSPDGNGRLLETPKDTLFDSFAPGPDKFMLAPQQRKYREELRSHIVRRLNFSCTTNLVKDFSDESGAETSSDEEKSSDEEQLFEIVYGTILDAILTEKTQEFIAHDSDVEELRTPKSARVLSWGAETCPGAPMKKTIKFLEAPTKKRSKFRNIGKEICRKLEF